MTDEQIALMRRKAAIEGELRIIEAIPGHHFNSVSAPDRLGTGILKECVQRIRELNEGKS